MMRRSVLVPCGRGCRGAWQQTLFVVTRHLWTRVQPCSFASPCNDIGLVVTLSSPRLSGPFRTTPLLLDKAATPEQRAAVKPCSLMQEKLFELLTDVDTKGLKFRYFTTNIPGTKKHPPRHDLDDNIPRCLKCGCTIDEHGSSSTVPEHTAVVANSGELPKSFVVEVQGDDASHTKLKEALIDTLTRFKVAPLECVKSAPNWESAAELALFVASAKRHNVDLNGLTSKQISDKLATLRQSGKNETFLEQAAKVATFNIESFVPAHKNTVMEMIEKLATDFNDKHSRVVLLDNDHAPQSPTKRHVKVRNMIEEGAIKAAVGSNCLPVLVGCSGSGKTASMIATASRLTSLSPLYWALSGRESTLREIEEMKPEDSARRNESVGNLILQRIKAIFRDTVTESCDATVALVFDELGEYPNFLRGLCALFKKNDDNLLIKEPLQELRAFLKCKKLIILAGGTGCDIADSSVGSASNSYIVIRMDDDRGADFLDKLLAEDNVPPKLARMLAKDSSSWCSHYVREGLLNRRVAALFLAEARTELWSESDWQVTAPVLLQLSALKFKALNALCGLTFGEMVRTFAEALAVSLGGRAQKLKNVSLSRKYGLVVDKAEVVNGKVELREDIHHRFGLSAAVVRLFLSLLMGVAPRPRSGDAFEQTVADFLVVQLLAGTTDVSIAAMDEAANPLEQLKESVRRHAKEAHLVATVPVDATNADDALQQAAECLGNRLSLDNVASNATAPCLRFAVVARNRGKAPAADLFVVSGTLQRGGDGKWLLCERAAPGISVKAKDFTDTDLAEYDVLAEFFEMGSRRDNDCKGAIAANVTATDLASPAALDEFQTKLMKRAPFELSRPFTAYLKGNYVLRASILSDLKSMSSTTATAATPTTTQVNDLRLVALVGDNVIPQWRDDRVVFLSSSVARRSLAPITLRDVQTATSGTPTAEDVYYTLF